MGARCGLLHCRVEKGVTEEVQRTTENNSGIISGLKASNKKSVLANSMRVLVRFTKTNKKTKQTGIRKCINDSELHGSLLKQQSYEKCTCICNLYSTQVFYVSRHKYVKSVS